MNTTELIKLLQKVNIKSAFRQDTAENWKIANPILGSGEPGYVIDGDGLFKIGDGKTAWNDLKYSNLHENTVEDVQPNSKYFVRQRLSPSEKGRWIEVTEFDKLVRDTTSDKPQVRENGKWVDANLDGKANQFIKADYIPATEDNVSVNSLKIKANIGVEETKTITVIGASSFMEETFTIEYNPDRSIQLKENDLRSYDLYKNDIFIDHSGKIAGTMFTFDSKTQTLSFHKQVMVTTIPDELKDLILVPGDRSFDLKDLYDLIPTERVITTNSLYQVAYDTEVNMGTTYNDGNELKALYGIKIKKENISTQEVLLSGISNVIQVTGTLLKDDQLTFIPGKAVDLVLSKTNLILKTAEEIEPMVGSKIDLVILYTK